MSNISLSKTEKNAQILLVELLFDENIDKVLADFMSMCTEETGDEIFLMLTDMVEQGKSKFKDYVSEMRERALIPVFASDDPTYISKMQFLMSPEHLESKRALVRVETTFAKMSNIWSFAAWVPKQATWLNIEELNLRIKILHLYWNLKQNEKEKQASARLTVAPIHGHTTQYIPEETPPKHLQSVYNKYFRGQKDIVKKISVPKDLFINPADMDKCIDALYRLRPYDPIIDHESRRWLNPRGAKGALSAWVKWLEDNPKKSPMIHSIRPIKNIIPLLRDLFPGLNISERMLKDPDPLIVAEFKALS